MLLSMSFCVSEKYPLIVKFDRHKDGCYLKRIFGVGRTHPLNSLCSVNIHDACFNLYFATCEYHDPL